MEAILALQHGQRSRVVFLSPRLLALATFVGSKEDDVVLVVSSDADEAIGSESHILSVVNGWKVGWDEKVCCLE